jgi:hypothetical protein
MCVHPGFPAERWGRMIPALHRKGHPMAHCEVVQVPRRGRDVVELRAAPAHEPLASCAFEWPRGWRAHTTDWQPPALFETAYLFGLTAAPGRRPDGRCRPLRGGGRCAGLSSGALGTAVGERAVRSAWTGLSVAALELPAPESSWRVVCSGPAVHLLEARGLARRYVDRAAARPFAGCPGYAPPGEHYGQASRRGRCECLRPQLDADRVRVGAAHGYLPCAFLPPRRTRVIWPGTCGCMSSTGAFTPAVCPAADCSRAVESELTWRPGRGARCADSDDAGPGGPTTRRDGRVGAQSPSRRGTQCGRSGRCSFTLDGCFPGAERAPLTRLNGRRAFDVAVATSRSAPERGRRRPQACLKRACSSPLAYISVTMSQPPTNSPFT